MKILGIKVSPATAVEIHQNISRIIESGKKGVVLSGNVHGINTARKHAWLKAFYNTADIVRVDGAGIVLGAKILGQSIPKRLTWADWGWMLAEYCSSKGHTLYFLGGPDDAAKIAAEKLTENAPGLKVLGSQHGYFNKKNKENKKVIDDINTCNPDILVVGMGMPLQERWLLDNLSNINAKVFITAGAAFEYLSCSRTRCPRWMGEIGFEWLFRLLLEPKRMAGRYLMGNTIFMINILQERLGLLRE